MAHPKKAEEDKYVKIGISLNPELEKRLMNFCQSEERSISWVVRKALEDWLSKRGC